MEREMQSLIYNKTWKLVELPTDHTLIDSKWMYKLKDNPARDDTRSFKARLVAIGFTREKGVDYNKVFSPIAKYATMRLGEALRAQHASQVVLQAHLDCLSHHARLGQEPRHQ
ncbi:hypothetical protein AXG93_4421s1260 [Marchantia polymorpha subsp. ruderalis]|uniref:Reverse transcriptase Ty1/copia-type domain-containing protein n=1 Tax=Marchantia polymorpha subsp. ruderalis TaxID=1480154 RepID=A0A176WH94_MARPO|nr:hypothetical protein AXG93_4421s1260 [Marchantia polymorpha subsp. ruderalis]